LVTGKKRSNAAWSGGVAGCRVLAQFRTQEAMALEQGAHHIAAHTQQVGCVDLVVITAVEGLADQETLDGVEVRPRRAVEEFAQAALQEEQGLILISADMTCSGCRGCAAVPATRHLQVFRSQFAVAGDQ